MGALVVISHCIAFSASVLLTVAMVIRIWIYLDVGVNWNANNLALIFYVIPTTLAYTTAVAVAVIAIVRSYRLSHLVQMLSVCASLMCLSGLLAIWELWQVGSYFCRRECGLLGFVNRLYEVAIELLGRLF